MSPSTMEQYSALQNKHGQEDNAPNFWLNPGPAVLPGGNQVQPHQGSTVSNLLFVSPVNKKWVCFPVCLVARLSG